MRSCSRRVFHILPSLRFFCFTPRLKNVFIFTKYIYFFVCLFINVVFRTFSFCLGVKFVEGINFHGFSIAFYKFPVRPNISQGYNGLKMSCFVHSLRKFSTSTSLISQSVSVTSFFIYTVPRQSVHLFMPLFNKSVHLLPKPSIRSPVNLFI